jgi:DNA-binding transcriptional LysR family regulator
VEIRQLRTFVAVAEELSFSRAAIRLTIAQPAVSQQVMQLEKSLDAHLFERRGNRIELTDAGRSLYADAPRLLADVADAATRARFAHRGQFGQLRIGFVGYYLHPPIPEAIADLRLAVPQLDVVVSHHSYDQLFSALSSRNIDVGVYRHWSAPAVFPSLVVDRAKLFAVLRAGHPLLASATIRLHELTAQPFVFINTPGYADTIHAACRTAGFVPAVSRLMAGAAAAMYAVAEGSGVALLPRIARLRVDGIELREIVEPACDVPTVAVWRSDGGGDMVRRLIDVVRVRTTMTSVSDDSMVT